MRNENLGYLHDQIYKIMMPVKVGLVVSGFTTQQVIMVLQCYIIMKCIQVINHKKKKKEMYSSDHDSGLDLAIHTST